MKKRIVICLLLVVLFTLVAAPLVIAYQDHYTCYYKCTPFYFLHIVLVYCNWYCY